MSKRIPGWRQAVNMAEIIAVSGLYSWLISPWFGFVAVSLTGLLWVWLAGAQAELIAEIKDSLPQGLSQ